MKRKKKKSHFDIGASIGFFLLSFSFFLQFTKKNLTETLWFHIESHTFIRNKNVKILPKLYWIRLVTPGDYELPAFATTATKESQLIIFPLADDDCIAIYECNNQSKIEEDSRAVRHFFYRWTFVDHSGIPFLWYFLGYFNHIINKFTCFNRVDVIPTNYRSSFEIKSFWATSFLCLQHEIWDLITKFLVAFSAWVHFCWIDCATTKATIDKKKTCWTLSKRKQCHPIGFICVLDIDFAIKSSTRHWMLLTTLKLNSYSSIIFYHNFVHLPIFHYFYWNAWCSK